MRQDTLTCVSCGHPASHHRTGERNQYNAGQSRCAYKERPSDAECPCQLHRAAALPEVTRRADGAYTVGPPPDGRSVDEHLDELAGKRPT